VVIAVVLAAGAGSRYGGPDHKLLVDLDGTPVLRRAVDAAVAAGIGPVVVVTGSADVVPVLADLVDAGAVILAGNPAPGEGQAGSVLVGVEVAADRGAEAVVVGLGDMPLVSPAAWRAVAAAPAGDDVLVTAVYPGPRGPRRSPPVRIPRSRWAELPGHGDEGARALMRDRPDLVVEVPVDGDPLDVDEPTDLPAAGT
jgi:CTP:molybdopterin cytidylyltransferase MocA